MLGYDISWAAFNIIEVMSSSKFTYKVRISFNFESFDLAGIFKYACIGSDLRKIDET